MNKPISKFVMIILLLDDAKLSNKLRCNFFICISLIKIKSSIYTNAKYENLYIGIEFIC